MIPFVPLFSLLFATIKDSELKLVERRLQPPKEIEDMILTGVLDDLAATIALHFAEEGRDEIWQEEDLDILRAGLDAIGASDVEIFSCNEELSGFYGAWFDEWVIRAEPWRSSCVDNGFRVSDGVLPFPFKMPRTLKGRIREYKLEAEYRRKHLSGAHVDGPPAGFDWLVLELWAPPSEDARARGVEAISVEVWKENKPKIPTKPKVQPSRTRRT